MPLPTPAADDPLSWRVLLALAARLERIRIANGYLTDLGADVRVDGGHIDLRDGNPVTWVAGSGFATGPNSSARLVQTQMEVDVTCFVPGDSADQMRLAHRARADLQRAFADTSVDMPSLPIGSGTVSLTGLQTLIEPRPDGANCILVQINAQAGLVEKVSAP